MAGRIVGLLAGVLLAGCGGSAATGPGGATAPVVSPAAQQAALDALAAGLEDLDFTPDLPASGEARYDGFVGATAAGPGQPTLFLTGMASLTARFGAGTLSGRLGSFAAAGGAPVSGDIAVENGTIGITGFSGDLAGTLRVWGADRMVTGTATGALLGPAAEGLTGALDTTLTSGSAAAGTLTGEVWATR